MSEGCRWGGRSDYTLEERDGGFWRFRVIYHLGYIAKAGNESIVWKRFRRRSAAERWMAKASAKTWRRA